MVYLFRLLLEPLEVNDQDRRWEIDLDLFGRHHWLLAVLAKPHVVRV